MRNTMVVYILLLSVSFAYGQVFIGTKPTENSALFEVKSGNRGVLIPRIGIPDTLSAYPVTNPKEGLFVMNTYPGNEGLFFWNGKAWEKLKTVESLIPNLQKIGKKSMFIGTAESPGMALKKNINTVVTMKASLGTVTADKTAYAIPEDGNYEVTASFTGRANQVDAIIALFIYNYTTTLPIAYTRMYQSANYKSVAAKAMYCGSLKKNDKIGLYLLYGTNSTSNDQEILDTAVLSIKKIN